MATRLTRAVGRLVHDPRWGLVTVTLTREGVYVRTYRARHQYGPVPYGAIALAGATMQADATHRARTTRRALARARRGGGAP